MTGSSEFFSFAELTKPTLREELQRVVSTAGEHGSPGLEEMISYQLGWSGENAGPNAEGKAIRPLMVLLAAEGGGGDWHKALPAAAAVELIHNFSLIHDDIEDRGETRRGRSTVWKIWGEAQAINTGDAMFALANQALANLEGTLSAKIAFQASRLFHSTCLRLTQGQHLDISFETRDEVDLEDFWLMVGGKTAALLAFSLEVGSLCACVDPEIQAKYRDFGHYLGMAFQVQDDILGIWGDEELIGKSATGDLVVRKKTLPVLYGLAQKQVFYEAWRRGPITPEMALELGQVLEAEGGRAYAQNTADRLTDLALKALNEAQPREKVDRILRELAAMLLNRRV
jgi:geranylgeranyl diphosphate synthase type I